MVRVVKAYSVDEGVDLERVLEGGKEDGESGGVAVWPEAVRYRATRLRDHVLA
jgi:hypothetical protein